MQEQAEPKPEQGNNKSNDNKWADLKPCKFFSNKPVFIPERAPVENKHYYVLNGKTGKRTLYHERWIGGRCFHVCMAVSTSRCGPPVNRDEDEQ